MRCLTLKFYQLLSIFGKNFICLVSSISIIGLLLINFLDVLSFELGLMCIRLAGLDFMWLPVR